ncbi:hypothetical protein BV898_03823 [Hypsibius exemplaris]|uniref:SAM domain-containing protein n=1 Tax=Hypsibius exemplaris TaxID=2072580 RepID=A0A1W0X488_HYPEX|nr:hypothetical protein BV898_03823 [Hypsibius exemplaris]
MRRPSPARPVAPPPYPGRSVILNYDIDDPLHWKNQQGVGDKKVLQVAGRIDSHHHQRQRQRDADNNAAGAILTLGELKRKQMHKRRCKLAQQQQQSSCASGVASGESGNYSVNYFDGTTTMMMQTRGMRQRDHGDGADDDAGGEEEDDGDSRAEVSLERRLRRLIEKENLTMDSYPAVDYRLAPTTSFDTPDPETVLHPLISPLSDVSGVASSVDHYHHHHHHRSVMRPPSSMAPNIPCQSAPPKPPRTVRATTTADSKFHVYGITATTTTTTPATGTSCRPQSPSVMTQRTVVPQSSAFYSDLGDGSNFRQDAHRELSRIQKPPRHPQRQHPDTANDTSTTAAEYFKNRLQFGPYRDLSRQSQPKPEIPIPRRRSRSISSEAAPNLTFSLPPDNPPAFAAAAQQPSYHGSSSSSNNFHYPTMPSQPCNSISQRRHHQPRQAYHYPSEGEEDDTTPPLPPISPENNHHDGLTAQPTDEESGFWETQSRSMLRDSNSGDAMSGKDATRDRCLLDESLELDSTAGDQPARAASSDEGFYGNGSDTSSEDLARRQVLMMYDMQMQLLKALGGGAAGAGSGGVMMGGGGIGGVAGGGGVSVGEREKRDLSEWAAVPNATGGNGVGGYGRLLHGNQCLGESLSESETQLRCEMLEDHIATLARNIEYLTDEIQNQQAALRHLQHTPAQPSRVRFREPSPRLERSVPRSRLNSYSRSEASPISPPRFVPQCEPEREPAEPAVERTETMFSTPERVTKLTKFFGSEPPLVRLFLKKLGYEKYARRFEQEQIGLNELPYMTEDRLQRLGIPMGPCIRILREAESVVKLHESHSG